MKRTCTYCLFIWSLILLLSYKLVTYIPTNKRTFCCRTIIAGSANRIAASSLDTSGCNQTHNCVNSVEHVQVRVRYFSSMHSVVQITLRSPMGTVSTLMSPRSDDRATNTVVDWTFMTVHHWGEDPTGTWTLTLSVLNTYQTGTGLLELYWNDLY